MLCQVWLQDYFRDVTGLPISTYFSGVKLRWLVENVPDVERAVKEEACLFGTMDSWLIYKLTGGVDGGIHATDGMCQLVPCGHVKHRTCHTFHLSSFSVCTSKHCC